jgi:protein arginine kinase activator
MICENCHQREAVVKFTQVIGNKKKTLNYCQECAEKEGLNSPMMDISKVFGKIIIALLSEHMTSKSQETITEEDKKLICERCHLSWADFKKIGRLGCPKCYETFCIHLNNLLRRIHGSNRHFGKNIKITQQEKKSVPLLRRKLKKAIADENFELAAELRDKIRELDQNQSKMKLK